MISWRATLAALLRRPKYELLTTDTIEVEGRTLYRIRALRDFGTVQAGDRGGFVASEGNLSLQGKAWVRDEAVVYDNALVCDEAVVCDNARVFGDAQVGGATTVSGNTQVSGAAWGDMPNQRRGS